MLAGILRMCLMGNFDKIQVSVVDEVTGWNPSLVGDRSGASASRDPNIRFGLGDINDRSFNQLISILQWLSTSVIHRGQCKRRLKRFKHLALERLLAILHCSSHSVLQQIIRDLCSNVSLMRGRANASSALELEVMEAALKIRESFSSHSAYDSIVLIELESVGLTCRQLTYDTSLQLSIMSLKTYDSEAFPILHVLPKHHKKDAVSTNHDEKIHDEKPSKAARRKTFTQERFACLSRCNISVLTLLLCRNSKYSIVGKIAELEIYRNKIYTNSLYMNIPAMATHSNSTGLHSHEYLDQAQPSGMVGSNADHSILGGAVKGGGLFLELVDSEQESEYGFGGVKLNAFKSSSYAVKRRSFVTMAKLGSADGFLCTAGVVRVLDRLIEMSLACGRHWTAGSELVDSATKCAPQLSFHASKLVQHPATAAQNTIGLPTDSRPTVASSASFGKSSYSSEYSSLSTSPRNFQTFKHFSSLDLSSYVTKLNLSVNRGLGHYSSESVSETEEHGQDQIAFLIDVSDLVLTAAVDRELLTHFEVGEISAAVALPTTLNRTDVTINIYPDLYFDLKKCRAFDFSSQHQSYPVLIWTSNCVLSNSMITVAWKNLVDICVDCKDIKLCYLQKYLSDLLVFIFDHVQGPILKSVLKLYATACKNDAGDSKTAGVIHSKSKHAQHNSVKARDLLSQFTDSSDDEGDASPQDGNEDGGNDDEESVSSLDSIVQDTKAMLHVREIMEAHYKGEEESKIGSQSPVSGARPKLSRPKRTGEKSRDKASAKQASNATDSMSTIDYYLMFIRNRFNYRFRLTNVMLVLPRNSYSLDLVGMCIARVIVQNTLVNESWGNPHEMVCKKKTGEDAEAFEGAYFDVIANEWKSCSMIYDGGTNFGLRGQDCDVSNASSPRALFSDVSTAWLPHDQRAKSSDHESEKRNIKNTAANVAIQPEDIVSRLVVQVSGADVYVSMSDARFRNPGSKDDPHQFEMRRGGISLPLADIMEGDLVFESANKQQSPSKSPTSRYVGYQQRWRKVSEFPFNLQYVQDFMFIVRKNGHGGIGSGGHKHQHSVPSSGNGQENYHTTNFRILISEMEQESPLVLHLSMMELSVLESIWYDNIHEISQFFRTALPEPPTTVPNAYLPQPFPAYGSVDYFQFLRHRTHTWDFLVVRTDVKLTCYLESGEFLPVTVPALLDGKVTSTLLKTGLIPAADTTTRFTFSSRNNFGVDTKQRSLDQRDERLPSPDSFSDFGGEDFGFVAFPLASVLLSCLVLYCSGDDDVIVTNVVSNYAEIVDMRQPKFCLDPMIISVGIPNSARKFGNASADFGFDIAPPFTSIPPTDPLRVSILGSTFTNWKTINVGLNVANATLCNLDMIYVFSDYFGTYFWEKKVSRRGYSYLFSSQILAFCSLEILVLLLLNGWESIHTEVWIQGFSSQSLTSHYPDFLCNQMALPFSLRQIGEHFIGYARTAQATFRLTSMSVKPQQSFCVTTKLRERPVAIEVHWLHDVIVILCLISLVAGASGSGRGIRTLVEFLTLGFSMHTTFRGSKVTNDLYRPHIDISIRVENSVDSGENFKHPLHHEHDESKAGDHEQYHGLDAKQNKFSSRRKKGRQEDENIVDINSTKLTLSPCCPSEPTCLSPLIRSQPTFASISCDIVISYEDMLFCASLFADFWNSKNAVVEPGPEDEDDNCWSVEKERQLAMAKASQTESQRPFHQFDTSVEGRFSADTQGLDIPNFSKVRDEEDPRLTSIVDTPMNVEITADNIESSLFAMIKIVGLRIILIDNLLGLHLPFIQVCTWPLIACMTISLVFQVFGHSVEATIGKYFLSDTSENNCHV
jgi:hypothetical protein